MALIEQRNSVINFRQGALYLPLITQRHELLSQKIAGLRLCLPSQNDFSGADIQAAVKLIHDRS